MCDNTKTGHDRARRAGGGAGRALRARRLSRASRRRSCSRPSRSSTSRARTSAAACILTTDPDGRELCLRPDLTIPVSRDYLASPEAGEAARLLLSRPGVPPSRRGAGRIPAGRHRVVRAARHGRRRRRDARARARGDRALRRRRAGNPHGRRRAVLRAGRGARSRAGLEAAAGEGFQPRRQPRARPRPAGRCAPRASGRNTRACSPRWPAPTRRPRMRWSPTCCRSPASPPSAAARSARSPTASSNRRRSAQATGAAARDARADRALPRHRRRSRRGRRRAARARGRARSSISTPRSTCSRAAPAFSPRAASMSARIRFSTAFGRGLDYYTGFVFELHDPDRRVERQLVAGGRYDELLTRLGAQRADPGGRLRGVDRAARRDRERSHERAVRHRRAVQGPAAGERRGVLRARRPASWSSRAARATIAARSPACPASRSPISRPPRSPRSWRRARCISASPARTWCARRSPTPRQRVVLIEGLGFGYANVVVAVPQAWIDVRSMADLDDVATAFRADARPQDAGRDQIREPDARLLLAARHHRLPHRRKPRARPKARRRPAPPS